MMTIKRVNGMVEKTVVVDGKVVFYTRLRDRSSQASKQASVEEQASQIKVEIPRFESYSDKQHYEYQAHEASDFEERFQQMCEDLERRRHCETICHELVKRHRKRMQPRTKLQKAMDMVGIDRAAVYQMLSELERRL